MRARWWLSLKSNRGIIDLKDLMKGLDRYTVQQGTVRQLFVFFQWKSRHCKQKQTPGPFHGISKIDFHVHSMTLENHTPEPINSRQRIELPDMRPCIVKSSANKGAEESDFEHICVDDLKSMHICSWVCTHIYFGMLCTNVNMFIVGISQIYLYKDEYTSF